jgi:hypothetical protein
MKYLLLLLLISCQGQPHNEAQPTSNKDSTSLIKSSADSFPRNLSFQEDYEHDTMHIGLIVKKLNKFPEVQLLDKQIRKASKGIHGVSYQILNKYGKDTSYYVIEVGDNSHDDRYINVYTFLMEKKTSVIKIYEPVNDSFMSLKEWRRTGKFK